MNMVPNHLVERTAEKTMGGRAFAKRLMPQSHSATSKRCRGTLGFIGATPDLDVTDAIWVAAS
jgi:hypothetical protein